MKAVLLFIVIAVALGVTSAAGAAAKPSYWTEGAAEKFVIQKARIACRWVREPGECNLRAAIAEARKHEARLAECNGVPCGREEGVHNANWHLERIRDGFPVETTECIGGGKTDAGGFRFSQFRCKIVLRDRPYPYGYGWSVTGRIAVYVTGPRSFRWAVIS